MNPPEKQIWFPAKTYGWGWGPPCCWKGWVVIGSWSVLLIAGLVFFRSSFQAEPPLFIAYVFGCSLVLIVICWWKGEPPRWRWGKDT